MGDLDRGGHGPTPSEEHEILLNERERDLREVAKHEHEARETSRGRRAWWRFWRRRER